MKRIQIIPALLVVLGIMFPIVGLAKPTPTPVPTPVPTPQVTQISKNDAERLARLKEKGVKEIQRRNEVLVKLNERLDKMGNLRDNDRKALSEQVKAEQKSLADILVLIQNEGLTLIQMRSYIVLITGEYRTFSVIGPKVSLMIGLDHLGSALVRFDDINKELKARADVLRASGKLTGPTETIISDMQNKLDDAHLKYTTVHDAVLPIRPTDFSAIKGTLQTQRDTLRAAYESLKRVLQDARDIRQALDKA